jgi:hypothetical protein
VKKYVLAQVADVRHQTVGQKSKSRMDSWDSVYSIWRQSVLAQARAFAQFYIELACVKETCDSEGIEVTLSITMGLVTTNPKPTYRKNATASAQVLTSDFEFIEFRRLRRVSLRLFTLMMTLCRNYYQVWISFSEAPSLSQSKSVS